MKLLVLIPLSGVFLVCMIWTAALAQDEVVPQLWADYHAHYYMNERNEFYGDAGIRFGGGDSKFVRFYARPSIRHHRSEMLRYLLGIGVFLTDNIDAPNQLEIRPWQGLRVNWPKLGTLTFSNLFRLEQRFTFSPDDSGTQLRFRYQLGTSIQLTKVPWQGLYIPASVELFWEAGDDVDLYSDQIRITSGLGYVINDAWIMTFVITGQGSQSNVDKTFTPTDIIIRFQLKHLLSKRDFRGRVEAPDN
jgi:hypothetical protein